MKRTLTGFILFLIPSLGLLLVTPTPSVAQGCKQWVAKMVSIQGSVQVKRESGIHWQTAGLNETYCPGDTIRVQDKSRASLALPNQPVLRLDQNTTLTLRGMKEEKTSLVDLAKGAVHFFSRSPKSLSVSTAFVNAGVEGTEFLVRVDENSTFISVYEGKVLASNQAGSLTIGSGQSAVSQSGRAPIPRTVVRPRDAIQWTLYYPPVLAYSPSDFQGLPGEEMKMVQKSIEAYGQGNLTGALENLNGTPEKTNDPRLFNFRAMVLLSVGRVDEAKKDTEQSLSIAPTNSDALALQSSIAVARNEKETALTLANKAVEADAKSASALIALSYAQQAHFNLDDALKTLQEAVRTQPDNALAWARLAEMEQSFGELGQSLEAARKAVALNPDLSRTQSVLGFAHLTRTETSQAREAFGRAIHLDQADPLPRLGLGLARIREGDLKGGRQELEVAVSLDPDNALVRSYLGKAYYEEKMDKLAEDQYHMAKKLDPKDPTAFFYEAIQKQATNRPVEALQDLQQAMELNDNRAVYRSQLLLDQDLAARSASLARIYSDLGFQQLALLEGYKSVNTDPANYSAHRFLADSYSILPRHEIARVSELLQSQLLQPLNMTPIQPRLAESSLFLINAGGPGTLSFNEFNPLFNRNGVTLQAGGLMGENNTWSGEGVLAGIYDRTSFSAGYSHFETDGWRKNADQKDDMANVFAQAELSPLTSLQGEYRYRDTKKGDLRSRFFPEDFFPGERNEIERQSFRIGLKQAFSPNSIVLGSFVFEKADYTLKDRQPIEPVLTSLDIKRPETALGGEVQYLFRSANLTLTTGLGYHKIDGELKAATGMVFPPPDDFIESNISTNIGHLNFYAYSSITLLKGLVITAGASADLVNGDKPNFEDRSQFNPKLGITWNPFPGTTLRGAVFRVLKRTLISNQTIEPTQVAGFNQFFDDVNGTGSWRYGLAADQKFSKCFFGGVEFSRRDLEVPYLDYFSDPSNPTHREVNWQESLARAYLFWTPHPWLAFRAEYHYERIERDEKLTDGPKRMNTHRIPLGIHFFHPSGLGAALKATYYNQNGEFEGFREEGFRSGSDSFWVVDTGIMLRLPKRNGLITIGVTNLFNQNFNYYDIDLNNSTIQPKRTIYGRITLAFP